MRPKNITALGLLLLVALPLILSVGIFVKQKIVQFQRTERFKTEHLQTISLAAEKIFWVKRGKEILLHGKLFDVKSYRISG
ncbi:MAG TPA: hypothetical protein VHL77_00055, partial [Ferruginibacter sp.]|nr:hypothetical protein [Ferruginibacter sp.]